MTAGFALALAVLLSLVCGALIAFANYAAWRDAETLLRRSAQQIHQELADDDTPSEILKEHREALRADNLTVLVVGQAGRVLSRSQDPVPAWPRKDDGWRVVVVRSGAHTVVVGMPWAQTEAALRDRVFLLSFLGLFVVVAGAGGAWLLVGRTLQPIALLSREARAASADRLDVCLSAPSPDAEVTELVATLNDLLARLGQTAASKGRFYAAASHELRTPLQALSGHLEVALNQPRSRESYHATVEEAHRQTGRLISLTQDLLLLNRLENANGRPANKPVDLSEVCDQALCRLGPQIARRGLKVTTDMPPGVQVLAPPTHADMLVRNLLENATKYANPGGRVCVTVAADAPENATLLIFNECAPLAPSDIEQLFEPFFRPDASRSAETGGNGLGLAICKAIAVANNWDARLTQAPGGIRVLVCFAETALGGAS